MAKRNSGEQKSKQQTPQVTLLDLKELLFHLDGKILNVEDATDEEFDQFIRQHVQVGWSLEDRRDAINTALQQGRTMGIQNAEKSNEKSKQSLIFPGDTSAQEAR